ncbi:hypothetical protein SKAU_G00305910 [Synaphobranchus kaupii]|uniref:Uncharacterized protein n=1 Tax=Synaphobranchus kaupii TaxID=118154 RepID=A0A9Q1EQU7_SYNKA|nr:hypothetical protein SKAU_G00305910 [Synaphobranchus kaupii]
MEAYTEDNEQTQLNKGSCPDLIMSRKEQLEARRVAMALTPPAPPQDPQAPLPVHLLRQQRPLQGPGDAGMEEQPQSSDGTGPQCRGSQQYGVTGESLSVLHLSNLQHRLQLGAPQPRGTPQQEQVLQPLRPVLPALEQQLRVRLQPAVPLRLQEAPQIHPEGRGRGQGGGASRVQAGPPGGALPLRRARHLQGDGLHLRGQPERGVQRPHALPQQHRQHRGHEQPAGRGRPLPHSLHLLAGRPPRLVPPQSGRGRPVRLGGPALLPGHQRVHRRVGGETQACAGALSRRLLAGAHLHNSVPDGQAEHEAAGRVRAAEGQVPAQHPGEPPGRARQPGEGAAPRPRRGSPVFQVGHLPKGVLVGDLR